MRKDRNTRKVTFIIIKNPQKNGDLAVLSTTLLPIEYNFSDELTQLCATQEDHFNLERITQPILNYYQCQHLLKISLFLFVEHVCVIKIQELDAVLTVALEALLFFPSSLMS